MSEIRVWDLPLRLFHWLLVLLVAVSGITGQFSADLGPWAAKWHLLSGQAILGLLLFRLIWGFAGGTYARFANFVRGPRAILAYCGEMLGRRPAGQHIGHNPLGGWSVLAMLGCLAVQVGSGLFNADEDLGIEGPLAKYAGSRMADWLAALHQVNFRLLLGLVGLHLCAIAFHRLVKGDDLLKPMLTGRKEVPAAQAGVAADGGHWLAGLAALACALGAVWLIADLA
jgi:cytochrome b